VTPCGFVTTDTSEENIAIIRVEITRELETLAATRNNLLVTAIVFPSSLILFTLMMEWLCSSETWALTKATVHHNTQDGLINSQNAVKSSNLTNHVRFVD
jgi:hypothetical protein